MLLSVNIKIKCYLKDTVKFVHALANDTLNLINAWIQYHSYHGKALNMLINKTELQMIQNFIFFVNYIT